MGAHFLPPHVWPVRCTCRGATLLLSVFNFLYIQGTNSHQFLLIHINLMIFVSPLYRPLALTATRPDAVTSITSLQVGISGTDTLCTVSQTCYMLLVYAGTISGTAWCVWFLIAFAREKKVAMTQAYISVICCVFSERVRPTATLRMHMRIAPLVC